MKDNLSDRISKGIFANLKESIYTIPVNEAFDSADNGCPFCALFKKLEINELDLILGASMMEPDIRIETNKKGFCGTHLDVMFTMKNRLGLGLMLESQLGTLPQRLKTGGLLSKDASGKCPENIAELEKSCYVCDRIESSLSKMFNTAVILWAREPEFKKKLAARKMFCLPHYRTLLESARGTLPKKDFADFVKQLDSIQSAYLEELTGDVSWFCKKFDYRYDKEPWKNSRDAVERTMKYLKGVMR